MEQQQNQQPDIAVISFIMWGAMITSGMFIGLASLQITKLNLSFPAQMHSLFYPFLSLAIVISFINFKFILSKSNSAINSLKDQSTNLKTEEKQKYKQDYFTFRIVCWALFEAITILGFILTFLSGHTLYYLSFLAISLLGFIISKPLKLDKK